VQCESWSPNGPNEYIVRGIPQGEKREESFVLRIRFEISEELENEEHTRRKLVI
jgi:hypothetical protein